MKCCCFINNTNEDKDDEGNLIIPNIIYGFVSRIISLNKILISYNTNNKDYNYYIELNNVKIIPGRNELNEFVLGKFILHKKVSITNIKLLDYNDIIGDVYIGNICVNKWLVENGYANYKN
jgi:hypothetical protein